MKTIVLDWHALELDIKPQVKLTEYRSLIHQEIVKLLDQSANPVACVCPGCLSDQQKFAFEKLGFSYLECERCRTVYVSPRPSEEVLNEFYRTSAATKFWRKEILEKTKKMRLEKVVRPQSLWVLSAVDEYRPQTRSAVAVGYHNNLLIEELAKQEKHLFNIIATNPLSEVEFAGLNLPSVIVKPLPLSELASLGPLDLFLAFDYMDRCADPDALFAAARETLAPGGLFLATTTLISGFDLQVLWDRSESIFPPERLNLLSTEGLTILFERHGFEVLEFSTPGLFDVEIVERAIRDDKNGNWPRFIRYLVENRGEEALRTFQEYLQRYRLSSFARIVLRRSA